MGEIAEMMLTGVLCEMCGCHLIGTPEGYPRYCSKQCADDRNASPAQIVPKPKGTWTPVPKSPKQQCAVCGKWIKVVGMQDHVQTMHELKIVVDTK